MVMEKDKDLEILEKIRNKKRVGRKKGGGKKQNFIRVHHMELQNFMHIGLLLTIGRLMIFLPLVEYYLTMNPLVAERLLLLVKLPEQPLELKWDCKKNFIWEI